MMLRKDARDRYQNADQLLVDIDCALAGKNPEFARPVVDLAKLATEVTLQGDDAKIVRKVSSSLSTGFIVLAVAAVISVLLNLALIAAMSL